MKPKNRVMCPDCGRAKMLFETEKEANTFLKFNMSAVNPDGKRTMRVYYCPACCGYHISSHEYNGNNDRTDKLIKAYHDDLIMRGNKVKTDPSIEAGLLVDDLAKQGLKTRREVSAYLRTKKDIDVNVKELARIKYYTEYNIPKNTT